MQVELSPEMEQLVQTKVNSGRYDSPIDVLSHALQLLELLDTPSSPFAMAPNQIRDEVEAGWHLPSEANFSMRTRYLIELKPS